MQFYPLVPGAILFVMGCGSYHLSTFNYFSVWSSGWKIHPSQLLECVLTGSSINVIASNSFGNKFKHKIRKVS